ncbi:MAG TPA: hypothetical protein VKM36_07965 [Balneolaceae bacterium]|nr:hypothetical protein [Balneolaceae bacterium]
MSKKKDILTYEDYVQGIDNLEPEQQLSLVELLTAKIKKQIRPESENHKVTELEGLGEKIWNDVETEQYIQKERNCWD